MTRRVRRASHVRCASPRNKKLKRVQESKWRRASRHVLSGIKHAAAIVSFLLGLAAIYLAHKTLVGAEQNQLVSVLSGPYLAYESCVQKIEGKARTAFSNGHSLREGCYGEAHALWNALASAMESVGQAPSDQREYDEKFSQDAHKEKCINEKPLSDCLEKLNSGMLSCRNNIEHDTLDAKGQAYQVYIPGAKNSFSSEAWETWLSGLRKERTMCLEFVRSVEKRIAVHIQQAWWLRYLD